MRTYAPHQLTRLRLTVFGREVTIVWPTEDLTEADMRYVVEDGAPARFSPGDFDDAPLLPDPR